MPVRPGDFSPSEVWIDNREKRELAMRKRFLRGYEKWSEHTRDLPPLTPGSRVLIQNQFGAGKLAKKWDKSGLVLEDLGYNKYRVKVDGSGRVTDRNRQFLRKFTPVTPSLPGPTPNTAVNHNPQPVNPIPTRAQIYQPFDPSPVIQDIPEPVVNPVPHSPLAPTSNHSDTPESPASPSFVTPPSSPVQLPAIPEPSSPTPNPVPLPQAQPQVRRSTRIRNPPKRYNPAEYDLT